MKIKKLLVLSMLSLMGTSAWAEVPEGSWTMPEPQGLEFTTFTDDGTHYYLYNPAAKMFFASGNSWNTQASVRTFGYAFWLEPSSEEDAPEGSYELWNYVDNNDRPMHENHNLFTDDGGSTWVDHASQGNYSWSFTIVGDYVRFQNVALIADKPEYEGTYIGWTGKYEGANNSSVLKMITPDTEGASVDWKAVTEESYIAFTENEEAYKAYTDGVNCFFAAQSLRSALVEAEGLKANIAEGLAAFTNLSSTPEELNAAVDALKSIIEARKALKKVLDDATAAGFPEVATYQAIFDNGDATKEQLEKALADLNTAFVEWGSNNASVEHPADMTSKIKNPTFDNGDATTGWSGDAFGRGGTVSDGAEHYNKTYDTYQKITGLTSGVYAVGVNGYYRSGNYGGTAEGHWVAKDDASKYAKMYGKVGDNYYETPIANVMDGGQAEAQDQGDMAVTYTNADGEEVTVYVPNTMKTADYFFHSLNQYANKLIVGVDETGELTIGVKKSGQIDGDWSMFDDFSLAYYGAGADAAKLLLDESLKNYSEVTIPEGTIYTESYLKAYEEAYSGEHTADNFAGAIAVINGISGAKNALDKNIELWKDLQDLVLKIHEYIIDDEYSGIEPEFDYLSDYYQFESPLVEENYTLTNEELEAELAKVNEWIKTMIEKSKLDVYDGKNMTQYITNPGFDEDKDINSGDAEGWTIDKGTGTNIVRGPLGQANQDVMVSALGKQNFCFEAWHRYNWDVWQEVENLPVGMYELQVQGYVRCEMSGYTPGDPLEEPYTSPVYLYMNNAMSQFPSVYSEQIADEHYLEDGSLPMVESHSWNGSIANYPNSMGAASLCFGWNMYKTTAYGLIAKEGDKFRIGVKMVNNTDWWCIWDSFKLIYREPTVDIVKPELEKAIAQIDLTQPMGKSVYAKATAAIDAANAAKESNDAKGMFNALAGLYEIAGEVIASATKFAALQTAAEELADAAFISDSPAKNEASALVDQINSGIAGYSYEDAEIDDLKDQIAAMFTKLNMPADMANASDENPVECTNVMKSPSFEDADRNNTTAGWTAATGNLGNDDTQKSALAYEFWQIGFDMYQTIVGLPKGTYRLTVDAWCRNGSNAENYKEWAEDNKATMAYVYAVDGDSTVYAAPVANVMAGAIVDEDPGIDGVGEETIEGTSYYLPSSLIGGWTYMYYLTDDMFTNSVIAKVGDDGKLTVGVKKAEERTNSWVVLDNFRLFYLGTNSSATPSDGTAINTLENGVAAVKVEFFNLNGARINKPGKGVALMKQTLRDGSVKLQKVIIK